MVSPTQYKTVQDRFLLHGLMTAQIRVHDVDVEGILRQPVAEIGNGTFQPSVVGDGRDRSLLGCCASRGMSEFAGRKHSGLKYDR